MIEIGPNLADLILRLVGASELAAMSCVILWAAVRSAVHAPEPSPAGHLARASRPFGDDPTFNAGETR